MNSEPTYTTGQNKFLNMFKKFTNHKKQRICKLTGSPGTGKSFILSEAIRLFAGEKRIAVTAPTNTAVLNISEMDETLQHSGISVEFCTIHKALSLKLNDEDHILSLMDVDCGIRIVDQVDILVVDESSMLGKDIYTRLVAALTENPNLKLIIVGDVDQLPPVKEEFSPVLLLPLSDEWHVELSAKESMRFHPDSDIYPLVEQIRENVRGGTNTLFEGLLFNRKNEHGEVYIVDKKTFKTLFDSIMTKENLLDNPLKTRLLTYRRDTFKQYNKQIRYNLYGEDSLKYRYLVGEKCISYTTAKQNKYSTRNDIIGSIFVGDECTITQIRETNIHPVVNQKFGKHMPCWNLTIKTDSKNRDPFVRNIYVSPNEETDAMIEEFRRELEKDAEDEKNEKLKRIKWARHWSFMKQWYEIESVYSSTLHSAQGRSIDVVLIDYNDLQYLSSYDAQLYWRLLYVGVSRAKKKLIIGV